MQEDNGILQIQLVYEGEDVTISIISDKDSTEKCFFVEKDKATERCEAQYQILEGNGYTYEIDKKGIQLSCTTGGIVYPNPSKTFSYGRITPKNYVGTLSLNLGEQQNALQLEVLATKFDTDLDKSYRENYQTMLKDIATKSSDLLMQVNSPVRQSFEVDYENDSETIYQRFSFIHSLIKSPTFEEAILRIVSSPKTTWSSEEENKDLRSIRRFNNSMVRQLASNGNRSKLPSGHSLDHLISVPRRITSNRKIEHLDNAENRFIKHVLNVYLRFFEDCTDLFKVRMEGKESREYREAEQAVNQMESLLQLSFFNEISRPTSLPLGSPTLQRKPGYRQILRTWLMSEFAASLTWEGGEDVYSAGKKNIATLYEYWLFFQLHDLFKEKFNIHTKNNEGLIKLDGDKMHLRLKGGKQLELEGSYDSPTRSFNVAFSFNREFKGGKIYNEDKGTGSWTTNMRPDYTLSFWPKDKTQIESEKEDLIVHIHFDAKYKVSQFDINDKELNDVNELKKQERIGEYKNGDLLKMHAYKDAIRRTGGAYILYPGTKEQTREGFHEIIPGLGAFALNPSNETGQLKKLESFIDEVLKTLENRASHNEQLAQSRYKIHQNPPNIVREMMPEYLTKLNKQEEIFTEKFTPEDVHIIVAWSKDEEHFDWIKNKKKYNFRIGTRQGSIEITEELTKAKYLLLHSSGSKEAHQLFEIENGYVEGFKGPKILSALDLKKIKYPKKLTAKDEGYFYLVYDVKYLEESPFGDFKWDFKKLENYKGRRQSADSFITSLTELMKNEYKAPE
jgi:predicted component of viral defense system (DUF524 family)